jgi:hypothetical protein
MHSHIYHFLALAVLALLVHASPIPVIREGDVESVEIIGGILDNSINFSEIAEAILMPRIEEWLTHKPFSPGFSAITNSSSVFEKLAEYAVESEGTLNPGVPFVFSSNENVTKIEFETASREVTLTLLYRASEHGFLASKFHSLCDEKGATITLVKAWNGRMAAAYSGVDWGLWEIPYLRGFLASIVVDPGAIGGYSLQKYGANENTAAYLHPDVGPWFGMSLGIADRCHENEYSHSYLGPRYGYGSEGVDRYNLFGSFSFRVLEYEVYQVEIKV